MTSGNPFNPLIFLLPLQPDQIITSKPFLLQNYLELNGDRIYLQTKKEYRLGKKEDRLIVVEDTTGVFNPLTVVKQ